MSEKSYPKINFRFLQYCLVLLSFGILMFIPIFYCKDISYVREQLHTIQFAMESKNNSSTLQSIDDRFFHYSYSPWSNVGGCGGGGSGGGSGDGIKWIGAGVSGGLLDVEVLTRYNFGENFKSFSLSPRISHKTRKSTTVGLSIPILSKSGMVQYYTNRDDKAEITGGMGDISIDVSHPIGMSGVYSFSLGLSLPTGQYDIKRGKESSLEFLPASLQLGSGLYNASVSLNYTKDVEDGMWLANASFGYPFVMRPFSKQNKFLDTYYTAYHDSTQNRRFYYRAKPYGENDLGGYSPPNVGLGVSYAYRGVDHYVHSWSLVFSAPLGVAWIPAEKTDQYAPKPDPDHKAWNAAFSYGLEFSNKKFPFFIAISLPLHDKKNNAGSDIMDPTPFKKWDAPDFTDFQATIAVGIKATMF